MHRLPAARGIALLGALALALPAFAPRHLATCGVADVPVPNQRCESWAVVHDPEPDPAEAYQQPSAIALDPTGDLVVEAGYGAEDLQATGGEARSRWRLLGLDAATGAQRWLARPGPEDAYARPLDVAVTADGSAVVATGYAASGFGQRDADLVVVAVDPSSGATLWETAVPAATLRPDAGDARGWFVRDTGRGTLLVTGTWRPAQTGAAQGLVALTLDSATGVLLGHVSIPGAVPGGTAVPAGTAISPDGTTAYIGATSSGIGEYNIDMVAVAVDLTDPLDPRIGWHLRHDGRGHAAPDRAEAMALIPDGSLLVLAGISGNDTDGPPFDADYDVTTLALDTADGGVQWERREDLGGWFAQPYAAAASDDTVMVVGDRTINPGREGFALAYELDGTPRWTRTVTTTGNDDDSLRSVAITGERVVLGGASANTATGTALPGVRISEVLTTELALADGTTSWTAHWSATGIGDDAARHVVLDDAGNAYVLARVTRNVELDRNFYDVAVIAYRTE